MVLKKKKDPGVSINFIWKNTKSIGEICMNTSTQSTRAIVKPSEVVSTLLIFKL